jgi:hypothetical protein
MPGAVEALNAELLAAYPELIIGHYGRPPPDRLDHPAIRSSCARGTDRGDGEPEHLRGFVERIRYLPMR